jgi:tungstate transport system substrate-binding protein
VLLVCLAFAEACESKSSVIRLATTTSVENSGLLTEVLPEFTRQSGISVEVLAVGSGQALTLLRRGEAAAALTHDPKAEATALAGRAISGYRKIMFNDFVIVGPAADPAAVAAASDAVDAFRKIAGSQATFVSRGDASGTHSREQELWTLAKARPSDDRLLDVGQGMGGTLRVANERGAYTLSDRATFEQFRSALRLQPLFQGGPQLVNTYAVFLRSGTSGAELTSATALADWLADGDGRSRIAAFVANGQKVFQIWPAGSPREAPTDVPSRELARAR